MKPLLKAFFRTALAVLAVLTAACATLPKPTAPQLRWQGLEMGALIHFNMMTYGSCSADASTFNPTKLDTDQWAQSFVDMGVKEAVLVVKHGCGFTLWPSTALEPGGGRYNYSVVSSNWMHGQGDVVRRFMDSCNKRGIGVGYYYSLGSNHYAQTKGWTASQLESVEKQQLQELWGHYGNKEHGGLTEVWFDGGFEGAMEPYVKQTLGSLQPNSVAFNACINQNSKNQTPANCITQNAIRWVGTEAGTAPDPNWSTGYNKGGDPDADIYQPAECDTTLQMNDQWFYNAKAGIRSLSTLLDVYHGTVGRNGFLMMDFAPTPDGIIAPDQVQRYKEFGDYIRTCYGAKPVASVSNTTIHPPPSVQMVSIPVKVSATVDRILLQEDQSQGQAIRKYKVEALISGTSWQTVSSGTSIGNKKIDLLKSTLTGATEYRLTILATAAPTVVLKRFAVYHCT